MRGLIRLILIALGIVVLLSGVIYLTQNLDLVESLMG